MTLEELAYQIMHMPEDKRDQFLRDLRLMWATGELEIDDYKEAKDEDNTD